MITKIGAGRPKKSAKLKQLQGTFRAGREVQAVVNPISVAPIMPEWLTVEQREVWHDTVALLMPLGMLCAEHEAILSLYCVARSLHTAITAVIAREGVTVTVAGVTAPSALLAAQSKAGKDAWLYATHLGMTPLMRAKLNLGATPIAKPVNPFMDLCL